jgi:hypothetical protein
MIDTDQSVPHLLAMNTSRDLKIFGTADEQEELIQRIEQSLSGGWERGKGQEAECKSSDKVEYKVFTCSQTNSRPHAVLYFAAVKNEYLHVANMTPGDLTVEQEDALLDEFKSKFVEPAEKWLSAQAMGDLLETDNSMSQKMAELLQRFSGIVTLHSFPGAIRGNHPKDEQRFFDFIIQACEENSSLNEDELAAWFVASGWPMEQALKLSSQYRFGKDLLKHLNHR